MEEKSKQHRPMSSDSRDASNGIFRSHYGIVVHVYHTNIFDISVDCLVNSTDTDLMHRGELAAKLALQAGKAFIDECKKHVADKGPLRVGYICKTSAGNLPYSHVIHTVGPHWRHYVPHQQKDIKKCKSDLMSALVKSIILADSLGSSGVAIPSVSAGGCGCPKTFCADIYAEAVCECIGKLQYVKNIYFADMNKDMVDEIRKSFNKIDRL